MSIIDEIKERAKKNIRKIILPETMDIRILKAASICQQEGIADIILIGEPEQINKLANTEQVSLGNIKVFNPKDNEFTTRLIDDLYALRKEKGMTYEKARDLILNDYMYCACMLIYEEVADGIVSGACHSSSNTLRPALQIIKTNPTAKLVSAFFLMVVPNCNYGYNGTFVFSDAGLEQNPTPERLAAIAYESAKSFSLLTNQKPITALLSHSTKGSAKHNDVTKVVEALNIAKSSYPNFLIDGELQLDAAIVPEVAQSKAPDSKVAGYANVLVFPDLDSGNIGYKLVQRLASAEAYGPITQGMNKPVNDLSRGCSVSDIVGVIAITAIQVK